jgi:hypothetical protein
MGRRSDVATLKASSLTAVGVGNGTLVVDASSYEAGALFLDITAKTGTFTSYLFALQVSMDGTNWSSIGTSLVPATNLPASVGSVGPTTDITTGKYWVPVNAFVGPYVRLAWNTAGGTNVTFSASLSLRR